MKCFITGIAGFVGSSLAARAVEHGWTVTGIDNMLGGDSRNLPDGVQCRQVPCDNRGVYQKHLLAGSDVVYHTAAAPYEGLSVFSPELVFEHTLMSTVSILRACIDVGIPRFVLLSSMARYGSQPTPFREDMDPEPVDPYGCAKVAAEAITRNLCELHGIDWVIAVPHNVYGPRQRYIDPFRNVTAIMINRVLQGKPPVVYGDGSQRRSFTYIDDLITPLIAMATRPEAVGEVFNAGSDNGNGVSVLELARLVLRLTGSDLEPVFYPPRPAEVHTATCSQDKLAEVLGCRPAWALEEGLAEQIQWIRSHGTRPFEYHLPIELTGDSTPRTWAEHLI